MCWVTGRRNFGVCENQITEVKYLNSWSHPHRDPTFSTSRGHDTSLKRTLFGLEGVCLREVRLYYGIPYHLGPPSWLRKKIEGLLTKSHSARQVSFRPVVIQVWFAQSNLGVSLMAHWPLFIFISHLPLAFFLRFFFPV